MIKILFENFSVKKLLLYMIRWQLSSPILAIVMFLFGNQENPLNSINAAIVGNIIGSLIFFWIDILIFSKAGLTTQWEVLEEGTCYDCGKYGIRVYRLALAPNYNRIKSFPEFRCEKCSILKSKNKSNS